MLTEGTVGPVTRADGGSGPLRLARDGELITRGWAEDVSRGKVYTATTAVGGVDHGTALGTTVPWAIWNPPDSGVRAVLLRVRVSYVSGTLGAGSLIYCTQTQTAVPGGTVMSPMNCKIGTAATGLVQAKTSMTITTAAVIVHPLCGIGPMLATTAVVPWLVQDYIDGEIQLSPGGIFGVQGLGTAGTSPLIIISGTWKEEAI